MRSSEVRDPRGIPTRVREMAYWQLALLAPGESAQVKYDPAGDERQRDNAYREWKKLIPEGQVPKPPKAPAGKQ